MDFLSILDLIIAAYGVYFLSQWFKVRVKGEKLDPKSFLPGDMTLETSREASSLSERPSSSGCLLR